MTVVSTTFRWPRGLPSLKRHQLAAIAVICCASAAFLLQPTRVANAAASQPPIAQSDSVTTTGTITDTDTAAEEPKATATPTAKKQNTESAQGNSAKQSTEAEKNSETDKKAEEATASTAAEPVSQADSEEAIKLVEEGHQLFLHSDLAGAEAAFADAVSADPTNVAAHLGLIDVYLYQPQYHEQAFEAATATAALAGEDPEVLARLSWAQQGKHKFEEARKTAEHAVEVGPDNPAAHTALADIQSAMYEMDAAYENAKTAVDLDPTYASGWTTLGSVAFAMEKWDEAGDAYARAVELEPDFFLWQITQARYELDTTGDSDATAELAQSAFKNLPNHPYVLGLEVDLALEKNDFEAAADKCKEIISLSDSTTPYPDAYTCMVGVLLLQEKYSEAEKFQNQAEDIAWPERRDITVYRMRLHNDQDRCDEGRKLAEEWLKERSFSVAAMRMVGAGYLCSEEFDQAIKYFKQALEKLPTSLVDARLLANAYARDGKSSEALTTLRKFSKLAVRNPLYYQALYEVYLFLGQPKEAIKEAQRWNALRPESSDAKVSLALAQLFDEKIVAAQATAEQALEQGASDSTVFAILGATYMYQGDAEKGEEFLLKSLEKNDDNYLAHNYLTTLYLATGDCEKAIPQMKWLEEKTTNEDQKKELAGLIERCESGENPFGSGSDSGGSDQGSQGNDNRGSNSSSDSPAVDPADERAAIADVRALLRETGVRPRTVRFEEETDKTMTLVIVYTTRLEAGSTEFEELERTIAYGLAELVPDMNISFDQLTILSSANDEPQNYIIIATEAAQLWSEGRLSDQDFEDSWVVEKAQ